VLRSGTGMEVGEARRWDYGAEGAAFSVGWHQWWTVGRHRLFCGSLAVLDEVDATLFYTDPPWNNQILRVFERDCGAAHIDGGWEAVYGHIARLAAGRPAFTEGGKQNATRAASVLGADCLIVRSWPITYGRGQRECLLHYCGPPFSEIMLPFPGPLGMDDRDTPGWALSCFEPGTVADLCAGRGVTALAAEKAGWCSVNVELDPRRASALLSRLAKATGCHPKRLH